MYYLNILFFDIIGGSIFINKFFTNLNLHLFHFLSYKINNCSYIKFYSVQNKILN
jgi:hypothetical protein